MHRVNNNKNHMVLSIIDQTMSYVCRGLSNKIRSLCNFNTSHLIIYITCFWLNWYILLQTWQKSVFQGEESSDICWIVPISCKSPKKEISFNLIVPTFKVQDLNEGGRERPVWSGLHHRSSAWTRGMVKQFCKRLFWG